MVVYKFVGIFFMVIIMDKGKCIYINLEIGVQVVEDISGKYFRIYDLLIVGKRVYLDFEGNIFNNKVFENGKFIGRN